MAKSLRYKKLLENVPIKLQANKSRGKHIVAQRDILPGELLLYEFPSALVVMKEHRTDYCQRCLGTIRKGGQKKILMGIEQISDEIVTCKDCRKQSFWCSEDCKSKDFVHKMACPSLLVELTGIAGSSNCDYELVRLVLHIYISLHSNADENLSLSETPADCILDLVSHSKKVSEKFQRSAITAAKDLKILLEHLKPCGPIEESDIFKMACRVNSNSYSIDDPSGLGKGTVGVGMFPLVALINHSCRPNAAYLTDKTGALVVRAVKPIMKGQEVCVSYVDLFAPKWERQGTLLTTKHFWCECDRCSANTDNNFDLWIDAIKCYYCDEGLFFPADEKFQCKSCHGETESDSVIKTIQSINIEDGMELYRAGMLDSAQISLEKSLQQSDKLLFQHHYLKLNICANLASICARQKDISKASQYCGRALETMVFIAEQASLGTCLPEIAKFYEQQGQYLEILSEALKQNVLEGTESWLEVGVKAKECYNRCIEIRSVLGQVSEI
jgi:tetratricopeptide (TPR) repeat protein